MKISSRMLNVHDIELLYELNQQNVPELGYLDNVSHLKKLIDSSSSIIILQDDNLIIGFCLLFREGCSYKSPNYFYFKNKYNKFIYIDRVVVKSSMIGKGGGRLIYNEVFKRAKKESLPICCEVNIKPLNKGSMLFHEKLDFIKIDEKSYETKKVAFLENNVFFIPN